MVVVHAAAWVAQHLGQGLRTVVIPAAFGVGWDGGEGLAAVVIRTPAAPLLPLVAQLRISPVAAVEEEPGLLRPRE
jgi:hypothetical protein